MWVIPNQKIKRYGIRILNFIEIIDNEYKFGTRQYSKEEIFNTNIEFSKINSGFSGFIKKKIHMDKIKEEFHPITKTMRDIVVHKTIKGPVILSQPNIDFINPYCYDIKSAYPYWAINLEFPFEFIKTNEIRKMPHCIHFGRIIIKELRPKHSNYLPLFLKEEGQDSNDINVVKCNRRIMAAQQYCGYCFLEDTLPIIQNNYHYSSIKIDFDQLWMCPTKKLPQESIDAFIQLFEQKEKTKADNDKLILNRSSYGIFITHKTNANGVKDAADYEIPYQVGIYIVSHQAYYMDSVIQKIGVEHIIAAHTDSIKADYDISEIIKEENKRSNVNRLGTWEQEHIKRICYYSNTRAKLLDDKGKLKIKHGGISQRDVDQFLANKTYDSINGDTPIKLTLYRFLKANNKGMDIFYKRTTAAFSADLEEE